MAAQKPGDAFLGCADNVCGCIMVVGFLLALLVFLSLFADCGH